MNFQLLFTVFSTVFLAELGDKTQLATILFASKQSSSLFTVFLGAALALIATSAIGVAAGALVANWLDPKFLSYAAGLGFIAIGVYTLWQA